MMQATLYQHQVSAERGVGGTPIGGYARPTVGALKFQFAGSSLRSAREKRAHCRSHRAPAFVFTPRSTDPDEIHELRICDLTGRQPVLTRAASLTPVLPGVDQSPRIQASLFEPVADALHDAVLSVARLDDQQHREAQLEPCSLSRGIEFPR